MERLDAKYADLVKIHKALALSIKRYEDALAHKNIDDAQEKKGVIL
jgi:hypothetical protein